MLPSAYKQVELNQTEKLLDRSGRVSLQRCVYLGAAILISDMEMVSLVAGIIICWHGCLSVAQASRMMTSCQEDSEM
jgi:hypothetical protein